jgi:hypothetical protein
VKVQHSNLTAETLRRREILDLFDMHFRATAVDYDIYDI